jgi:hypothetical protein
LRPVSDITAGVALLVTEDPQRLTWKLRRAAELGVEVATYATFAHAAADVRHDG